MVDRVAWQFSEVIQDDNMVRVFAGSVYAPITWLEPRVIDVDPNLFHPRMPLDLIDDALYVMQRADRHSYVANADAANRMRFYCDSEVQRVQLVRRLRCVRWVITPKDQAAFDSVMDTISRHVGIRVWMRGDTGINANRYQPHEYSFDPRKPGLCDECGRSRLYSMHVGAEATVYTLPVDEQETAL